MQLALLIGAIALPIGAAVVMFVLSLPREQDYYAMHLADILRLTNSRTSPADHVVVSDPPTTGGVVEGDDAASFIQSEGGQGGCPAAPAMFDCRGRHFLN
jgi:hypothetical protein